MQGPFVASYNDILLDNVSTHSCPLILSAICHGSPQTYSIDAIGTSKNSNFSGHFLRLRSVRRYFDRALSCITIMLKPVKGSQSGLILKLVRH